MSQLTRNDFIGPFVPAIEAVAVPELKADGVAYVRSFSAGDRGKLEILGARYRDKKNYEDTPKIRFLACVLGICDKDGNRIFEEKELDMIAQMPAIVVDRLSEVIFRLNGLDKKKIEELEKNSESAQDEGSPSA